MAAITYQELCAEFARDTGLNGGNFSAVTSTLLVEQKIAKWVRRADLYIQGLFLDWAFLKTSATQGSLSVSSDEIARPSDLRLMKYNTLILNKGQSDWQRVSYVPWDTFQEMFNYGTKQSVEKPAFFSIDEEDGTSVLVLSETASSASVTYDFDYYRHPVPMDANADTSVIARYGEQEAQEIVLARAKIMYAEAENAPEIAAGAGAVYDELLERLTALAHPAQRAEFSMGGPGGQIPVVETP